MSSGLWIRGRQIGTGILVAGLGGCGAGLVHQGPYASMPLAGFADSLGIVSQREPEPELGTDNVHFLGGGRDRIEQLANYFREWCESHHGSVDGDDFAQSLGTAADEYRHQQIDAGRPQLWGATAVCHSPNGAPLAGYITLDTEARPARVAFYEPEALKSFVDKFTAASTARLAKEQQQRTNQLAEAKQAQEEEDALVRASGVEGSGMAESLEVMERTRHGDMKAILVSVEHKPPCILVVGGRAVSLKSVHVNLRDEDHVAVIDAMTQDMGTVVNHIVDLADGANLASIEFSSAQNASTFGQGVEHLGRLCGAGH